MQATKLEDLITFQKSAKAAWKHIQVFNYINGQKHVSSDNPFCPFVACALTTDS